MQGERPEPGSFRDRTARVFYRDGEVYRGLSEAALANWRLLESTDFFREQVAAGRIVGTEIVTGDESLRGDEWAAVLRHRSISFVSYPYEWCFGMLRDAAVLQLELLSAALDEGMTLKDSTAFNIQWEGSRPVFIDIPSFEKLDPGMPWAGYGQFCSMFLYPLMMQAYRRMPFQPLLRGNLDGIDPRHCWSMMSARDLMRAGVLKHVYLQAKAQSRFGETEYDVQGALRDAGFTTELIKANVRGLRKVVEGLTRRREQSAWVDYTERTHYDDAARETKLTFVRDVIAERRRRLVWDIGCNTGVFSRLAAENSEFVVALDADDQAVEVLYQQLKQDGTGNVLPLVGNLADPSPALGWRGKERTVLEDRGKPELVLCLALIHHLVITANIHVDDLIDWLASLGADLVIEFVDKSDPMVRQLLRNKADIYDDYTCEVFERELESRFDVIRRVTVGSGSRTLYYAAVRDRAAGS